MIPKIIHYCWFGPNPLPKMVEMCIETWKEHLSGYQLMFWNETNSPMDHPFVQQAYARGKYAFVSDYVRLWAVYEYGGIYLDTDMFLIKPLDSFLEQEIFFGYEDANSSCINAAIFGAVQSHEFIRSVLDKYNGLVLSKDVTSITIPLIVTSTYHEVNSKENIKIFSYDYFYPFPHKRRKSKKFIKFASANTYAIHLWNFSWLTTREKILLRFIWLGKAMGLNKG